VQFDVQGCKSLHIAYLLPQNFCSFCTTDHWGTKIFWWRSKVYNIGVRACWRWQLYPHCGSTSMYFKANYISLSKQWYSLLHGAVWTSEYFSSQNHCSSFTGYHCCRPILGRVISWQVAAGT